MGDRLSADNSFFSSAESIKSNGVLPSRLSRMTLLIWQQTSRVSSTLSLLRLVPFGMILLINLWLFSTWGFCHDAWGSQKNTWVRINPGRVCSKALGFLNSTPLSVRITPKSLLNSAVPRELLRASNTWITLSWVPSFIRKIRVCVNGRRKKWITQKL